MDFVTVGTWLDTRRQLKTGKYPVKLRVTYERKSKFYRTTKSYTKADWEKITGKKPRNGFKEEKEELEALATVARGNIKHIVPFSFDTFEKRFLGKGRTFVDVFNAFEELIKELEENNQFSTASIYKTAKKSFSDYEKYKNRNSTAIRLKFSDVTIDYLRKYEKYILDLGKSITTVSLNTRCLRKLFNDAIDAGELNPNFYPFGKKKYSPPKHRNIKKALPIEDIKKIYEYKTDNPVEVYYNDIWMFSYLCYGINMADICRLKYSDVEGDKIMFTRQKTSKNKNTFDLQIKLTDHTRAIIKKHGTGKDYIFPVLNSKMTQEQVYKKVKQFTKNVNKYVDRVAKDLKIPFKVTTYYARHSFATIARNNRIPESIISQLLGHSSGFGVTGGYLDNVIPDFIFDEVNKILTNW